jgi:mRNA-degrading endonuclease RelE of RelBE toxin-antitoxin system
MSQDVEEMTPNGDGVTFVSPSNAMTLLTDDADLVQKAIVRSLRPLFAPAASPGEARRVKPRPRSSPQPGAKPRRHWTDPEFPLPQKVAAEQSGQVLDQSGWYLGMGPEFVRSVPKADRKLLGRVLVAMTEISLDPMELRGDTVKPLEGDKKGLWRYRIADWRLIYWPDPEQRVITLLSLAARGSAYQ